MKFRNIIFLICATCTINSVIFADDTFSLTIAENRSWKALHDEFLHRASGTSFEEYLNIIAYSYEDDEYTERPSESEILEFHKDFYLSQAEYERNNAHECFIKVEYGSQLIPDLDIRERLKTVISSAISSIGVKDHKEKVLVIGLAVIADLANHYGFEVWDRYSEMRKQLTLGTAYLEKANYWYRRSMLARVAINFQDELSIEFYQNEALDYLILLDMFTTTVENRVAGKAISNYISKIREAVLSDILSQGVISKKYSLELELFSENLSEITAEWAKNDKELVDEIYRLLRESMNCLKNCEEYLGIK